MAARAMTETTPNTIKAHRLRLGMTAKQLAEKVGTTQSTITRLEGGSRALSKDWMDKLSKALGIDAADLLSSGKHVDYVSVIGVICNGKLTNAAMLAPKDVFTVPFPTSGVLRHQNRGDGQDLQAFVMSGEDTWIAAAPIDKVHAANWGGKKFVVLRSEGDGRSELSLRTLEREEGGLYLVSEGGAPSQRAVRFDDPRVVQLWKCAWTVRAM
jgi:transcriptional regulator with XRE-family HTH domain